MKFASFLLGILVTLASVSEAQLGLTRSEFEQKFGQIDRGKYRARGFALEVEFTDGVATKITVGKNNEIALTDAERNALISSLSTSADHVENTPTKVIMVAGDLVRQRNAEAKVDSTARKVSFSVVQVLSDGLLCMDAADFTTFYLKGKFDAADGDKLTAVIYPAGKVEYTSVLGVQKTVRAYHTNRTLAIKEALSE